MNNNDTTTTSEGTKTIAGTAYAIERVSITHASGKVSTCWTLTGPRGGSVSVVPHISGVLYTTNFRTVRSHKLDRQGVVFVANADGSLGWVNG